MSLTSYRAAPPRASGGLRGRPQRQKAGFRHTGTQTQTAALMEETPRWDCRRGKEAKIVLGRPGNDLLSRVLRHSTIGAEEFNGRVRDGIGFLAPRSNHRTGEGQQARVRSRTTPSFSAQGQRSFHVNLGSEPVRVRKADRPPVLMHGTAKGTDVPAGV
jgi:hypothetical protein